MNNIKRLAWFTNSEGQNTISEYFSANLLPELRKYFEIEVYVDDFSDYHDFTTHNYLKAAEYDYDLHIYQLENHPALNFARIHCGLQPGMTIFHHYNFTSFGPEPILASPWQPMVSKYTDDSISWYNRKDELDQIGPLAHRESAWTLLPVFTNPLNTSDFKANINLSIANKHQIKPVYLPFPIKVPDSFQSVNNKKLAFLASPDASHRIHNNLWALKQNSDWQGVWLIEAQEETEANDLLKDYNLSNRVEIIAGRTPDTWRKLIRDCSLVSHFLFSAYEQPCPYLALSMAAGKVVALSDYGYSNSLPDNLCFKIPLGSGEKEIFAKLLSEVSDETLTQLGTHSQSFAKEHYLASMVAKEFKQLVDNNAEKISNFKPCWQAFQQAARNSLLEEVKDLYFRRFSGKEEFSTISLENLPEIFT